MKHTPGPWVSDFNGKGTWTVFGPSKPVCYVSRIASEIKSQHDAALIKAAPDLLEACKQALDVLDNMTSDDFKHGKDKPQREILQAAIAKAEGGE